VRLLNLVNELRHKIEGLVENEAPIQPLRDDDRTVNQPGLPLAPTASDEGGRSGSDQKRKFRPFERR
jgi:hypothetical protein